MSRYHKALELYKTMLTTAAKQDWTTTEGIVAGLRELDLENYGSAFQVYRGKMPLDMSAARRAVIEAVAAPAVMAGYQGVLGQMLSDMDNPDYYTPSVQFVRDGLLEFEHGDFRTTIDLADSGLQVAGPKQRKTRQQRKLDERMKELGRKREKIRETSDEDYAIHANQVGYLLRNVRLDFLRSRKMQGTSVKMKIYGLKLDQLQQFMDATGSPTLAALSTHEGTRPGSDDSGKFIYSGWIGFALEVIDFLNLELVIDIEGLKAQHRDVGGDTGFGTLEEWGADAETVVGQLTDRRPDLDAGDIREHFAEGYGGGLFME